MSTQKLPWIALMLERMNARQANKRGQTAVYDPTGVQHEVHSTLIKPAFGTENVHDPNCPCQSCESEKDAWLPDEKK